MSILSQSQQRDKCIEVSSWKSSTKEYNASLLNAITSFINIFNKTKVQFGINYTNLPYIRYTHTLEGKEVIHYPFSLDTISNREKGFIQYVFYTIFNSNILKYRTIESLIDQKLTNLFYTLEILRLINSSTYNNDELLNNSKAYLIFLKTYTFKNNNFFKHIANKVLTTDCNTKYEIEDAHFKNIEFKELINSLNSINDTLHLVNKLIREDIFYSYFSNERIIFKK